MNNINLPYKYSNKNYKNFIIKKTEKIDNFFIFLSKVDYLCNNDFIIKKDIDNKIEYLY